MLILAPNQVVKKYPYTVYQLKKDNPNTSFPKMLGESLLAEYGVFSVQATKPPAFNPSMDISEDTPVFQDGIWVQTWKQTPASAEEVATRTERKANEVRTTRNQLLTQTDWTQVADAPVDKAAWAAYRQALRDVPAQPGFPWDVIWPEQP